jgi:glycosyltransferase involved in cell wall biosynthesis
MTRNAANQCLSERARLRILQVIPAYYPAVRYGGPIRSVHGLSTALVRAGHDVHVFTTTVDGDQDVDVPSDSPVDLDGVQVRYFRVPAVRRLCWSPAMGEGLRRDIRNYDVVHLHSTFLWPTWAGARAASRAGVPYLIAPRGMLVGDMIRRKSRWVKTAWIELIERRTLREAAAVHVTAELEAEELRKLRFQLPELVCIPNGVDIPSSYAPLQEGLATQIGGRPYALFLSRISWKKGLDRLIRAWKSVPELLLVIAGNDEESYEPTLRALAREENVAERVLFVGPVSDEHKWALYAGAQFFLLPSYSENFGNAVVEAMAMSCPVIVSPDVGAAHLVESSGAGLVVNCEPMFLGDAARKLATNPELRRVLGERGTKFVAERLSWSAVAVEAERAYRRAIERTARQQVAIA